MCRYGMSTYKPHYACFECRKTFKRRLISDIKKGHDKNYKELPAKCPECQSLMANMGMDFEAPKKDDTKSWNHIKQLYHVGITFHSCGCTGPGYIPNNTAEMIEHFSRIKQGYLAHLHFWAQRRGDPSGQSEVARDKHYNDGYFYSIPKNLRGGTKKNPKYDSKKAQIYWGDRIAEIEEKINYLKNSDSKTSAQP